MNIGDPALELQGEQKLFQPNFFFTELSPLQFMYYSLSSSIDFVTLRKVHATLQKLTICQDPYNWVT